MKKLNRIISLLLAVVMLCSVATGMTITTWADEETTTAEEKPNKIDYLKDVFATPEAKLATMKRKLAKGNYEIWCDATTGEVAVKNIASGQILFSNPYDVGAATSSDSVKYELLSQIIIKYTDNGKEKTFSSYEYAALRDQITVKNIKNGIRVEYIIGREEARHLVPRQISDERFREKILGPMLEYYNGDSQNFYYRKFLAYYGGENGVKSLKNCATDRLKEDLLKAFPIVAKMDIWVLDPTISTTELEKVEQMVKSGCPEYSFEDMDQDHQMTEYESNETNPPVFKMALEYTLTEDGFTVRLPVNGLSYNESLYQLTNISILPYMGAGNSAYDGYVFYPDGSGTLFSLSDLKGTNTTSVSSRVYGVDYAYHQITGTYQQAVRYPAFGIVENTKYYDCRSFSDTTGEYVTDRISGLIYDKLIDDNKNGTSSDISKKYSSMLSANEIDEVTVNRGYTAIIEEGDALTNLVYYHAGVLSPYDTVMMNFNPRPQDSYNLADSISVGTNSEWTVTTERKYTGNFKVHYIMLTDETIAAENGLQSGTWYEASWLGMAFAYRDYLVNKGMLTQLTAEETAGDIPLYIETFGSLETTEKIASIPVTVKKALTSAADIITMYEELSKDGVSNINFKLTGYANGGMYAKMPYRLRWERSVSKDTSMQELYNYAASVENGKLGIYPDFDFSYASETGLFDGLSMRKHAIKTIDDRYSDKRQYSPTQQKYTHSYQMAISPAYFSHFYEKLIKNYLKIDGANTISVGSLGNSLNSDFDEDEPYNREDSRTFVKKALAYISDPEGANLEIMTEGGNAFTWQYVSHILSMSLDSSRYIKASYSVPFIGVVLHGYMNFTGTPLNMEGNVEYAKLKAIENGASIYFTLSYDNTELLKEDKRLNQYYSIRYDIWYDDVVEIYNEMNYLLKDVKDKLIIDHAFLSGMRVPDADELENDIRSEYESVLDYQNNKEEYEIKKKAAAVADARDNIASTVAAAEKFITQLSSSLTSPYFGLSGAVYLYVTGDRSMEIRMANYVQDDAAYQSILAQYEAASEEERVELKPLLDHAESVRKTSFAQMKTYVRNISVAIATLEESYGNLSKLLEDAETGAMLIYETDSIPQSIIDEIKVQLETTKNMMQEKLGIKFNHTVDKAELDTFILTHYANIMFDCYGENSYSQVGVVGKAENLYKMFVNEAYGLTKTDLPLLRYLEENRNLSDDALCEKYGIADGTTSVSGLLKYMKELIGDKYTFDSILSTESVDGELSDVDANIMGYFLYILYNRVTSMENSAIIPELNFVPTHKVNNKVLSNAQNINKLVTSLTTSLNNSFNGKNGLLKNVTDGNYDMSVVVSEEDMNKLVKTLTDLVQKSIDAGDVEYATPETLERDLIRFIQGKYYQLALGYVEPELATKDLAIQTVTYKTDSSLASLVARRLVAYGTYTSYQELVQKFATDTVVAGKLAIIAAQLEGAYGDTKAELEKAYAKAFATQVIAGQTQPTISIKEIKDGENPVKPATVNEELLAFVNEALKGKSAMEALAVIPALIEKASAYELDEGTDLTAEATEFVIFAYLTMISNEKTISFYYDAQLGAMDAAVRASVNAMHDKIAAELPADATAYDVYNRVFAALGDSEESINTFAKQVAANVTYYIEAKYSLSSQIVSYYAYLLLDSFDELGDLGEEPTLTIYETKDQPASATKLKNAISCFKKEFITQRISDLMVQIKNDTKRGEFSNYSLTSIMTEEELDAWVMDIYKKLDDSMFLSNYEANDQTVDGEAKDKLLAEIRAYILYSYYTAVSDKLDINKEPVFTNMIYEVYGDDLYTASQYIKSLLRYHVTTLSPLTEEDIDAMITVVDTNKEEEIEDVSKYLSADGRIVAVTYGDRENDGSYKSYKTFLLNYNNFSVSVKYDGVTYTIPAYGIVVVMH